MSEQSVIPKHIGFIMDGNRRWAKQRGLPAFEGHRAGYTAFKEVVDACFHKGVQYVTFYAFSTENWKREKSEVDFLMKQLILAVNGELKRSIENGIRIRFLGRRDRVSSRVLKAMEKAEAATRHLEKGVVAVCIDYGGHQEIADAARKCVEDGLNGEEITPEAIAARLYEPDIPPIDLVVRTSGEQRLSNFMLWRIEYSELLFIDQHWPDMTKDDVTAIIETYADRSRRFGG